MNLNSILFIDNLPKLDIHGLDRITASHYINSFIKDNIIMKNQFVVIIHGIGTGVLRQETINTLKTNKKVIDFKSFYNNRGCTIVQLKFD